MDYFIKDLEIGDGFEKRDRLLSLPFSTRQLLETAKTGVERAIATDEERAIAWMNQQLEVLEVNLT